MSCEQFKSMWLIGWYDMYSSIDKVWYEQFIITRNLTFVDKVSHEQFILIRNLTFIDKV